MSTLAEIDSAIRRLPPAEAWELARSLQEHLGDLWDAQFEADVKAGKLDALIADARADTSKVQQLLTAIDALTWEERCELNAALQSWPDDEWDKQMADEGKFDRLMEKAVNEHHAGQSAPWPGADFARRS